MAEKTKAKSKGFGALGVPVGTTLTFRKTPEITCKVVDDKNKVEYKGKVYPISGLAKELMKTPISGYHAFKYNGVLLAKLGDDKTSKQTANTAPVVPSQALETPKSTAPQTMPLPTTPNTTAEETDPLMRDEAIAEA